MSTIIGSTGWEYMWLFSFGIPFALITPETYFAKTFPFPFMPKKAFCTAILTGLSVLLFAQPPFTFSPLTIPNGQYGASYPQQAINVTGGNSPYTFSVSKGNLPPGISLSPDGKLSGTPHAAGNYAFTVTAKDAGKKRGNGDDQGDGKGKDVKTGSQDYTLIVDPAALTITANNASMTAGDALPAFSVTYNGLVNGDKASNLDRGPKVTTTGTSNSPAGAYPISASGAADPNYTISYIPGTLTIRPGAIVVTADPATKQFGTADPTLTYTATGLPAGVSLTGSLSRAPGENVGTYPITIGSLSAGGNYNINFKANNLTITKAAQEIAWTQNLSVGCASATQIQLAATASSGLPVTYTVSDNSIATITGSILTMQQPGTAVVSASQSGNGNYDAASTVSQTLTYKPVSLISRHWDDVIFFDNSSGDYIAWQWYRNDSLISGATNPYYSSTPLDGQFFVVATDKAGEQIQTCTLTVTPGSAVPGGIQVFPNPAARGSTVTVASNYTPEALQGAVLQLAEMTGRVFQRSANVQPSMQVAMPAAGGIYIIDLLLASGQKITVNVLVH